MSLQTFVLSDETAELPVGGLIKQAVNGGVEVRDERGKLIVYVVPPEDREAMAYLDACRDGEDHQEEIAAALKRKGGVTTKELLEKAKNAARDVA